GYPDRRPGRRDHGADQRKSVRVAGWTDHAGDGARRTDPVCAHPGRLRVAADGRHRQSGALARRLLGDSSMARVDVLMPQMGESIAEGTLSKWHKKVGDDVKRDEPLFEISTDKVDAEIPAPTAGVLAEIKVQQGQTVPVQTLVAVIETEKGAQASAPAPAPAAPAPAAKPVPAPAPKAAPAPAAAAPVAPPRAPAPAPAAVPANGDETAEDRLRRRSTPLVRKIAAEHQVDISGISGTGYAGRVTKQDILGYIERGVPAGAPSAPRIPASAPSGPIEHPAVEPWPGDRVEPWSKIRKITADHMI